MGFFDFSTMFIFVMLRNCDVIVIILSSYTRVIPCQIIRFLAIFPRTSSDSFEIWHTCRNCLENNIRQFFFYLGQPSSEIWPCEKTKKSDVFLGKTRISNAYKSGSI